MAGGLAVMGVGFLVASTNGIDTPYWGPVVLAMVLIAVGLGLATAPATESIMGSLPPEKAGVGSAVNDTTRELGGTLGVAVLGSVFSSVYGPRLADALAGLPIPAPALQAARGSVGATLAVARAGRAGGWSGHRERRPHRVRRRPGRRLPRGGRRRVPRRPARAVAPARPGALHGAAVGDAAHDGALDAAADDVDVVDEVGEVGEVLVVRS